MLINCAQQTWGAMAGTFISWYLVRVFVKSVACLKGELGK